MKLINFEEVESRLELIFSNKELLQLPFVHRSFWNENQTIVKEHNERLEFLGDSILGFMLAEFLYHRLPSTSEGVLSDLRSRLVEATSCVVYVQKLKIEEFLLLGKGEKTNRGKGRESILADLFEAIIGAIYLDAGFEAVKHFFFTRFEPEIEKILAEPARNWKAELQDYAQKKTQSPPIYEVIEESGPSHQKYFKVAVFINKEKVGEGVGGSKKEAQQQAACAALSTLG